MLAVGNWAASPRRWGRQARRTLLVTTCLCLLACYVLMEGQMGTVPTGFRKTVAESWDPVRLKFIVAPGDESLRHKRLIALPAGGGQVTRKLSSHGGRFVQQVLQKDYEYEDDDYASDDNDFVTSSGGPSADRHLKNHTWVRRLPQAIIIGVKKGGTRALLEILRLHPDVRAPGPEPHFFDRHYSKGLKWYRKRMPPSQDHQVTVEKTPSYFVTPEVPSRVFNMSRHVKLLVVVRDPVTRAISDYTQAVSKRQVTRSFEDMAFLNVSTGLVDTSWSAIKIGVYSRHLERWLRNFPLAQFHFVSGERLISDPVGEVAKVQSFLGLRKVIDAQHFFLNETKGFPCLRKSEGSVIPHCLGKTKGRSHPHIHVSAIQRLRDFYRPFNQKFFRISGQKFAWP